MSIGDRLRVIRSKKNYSQQEVADFLGIDYKTYASWEEGKVDIKIGWLYKLAEFYNIKIADLVQEKSGDIIISQHYSDYKDNAANNSMVIFLTDKEAIEQIMNIVKKKVEND